MFFSTKSFKSVFFGVCMFLPWFPSKQSNLHICRHETVPKHHVLQCFQIAYLPKPLKIPLCTVFSSIFPSSHAAGHLKHIYKKSIQHIVFHSVIAMFPSKNTVAYMFLAIKSVQNSSFCSVFNATASKNLSEYQYLHVFFTYRPVSPLPEACQNDPRFHVNTLLS